MSTHSGEPARLLALVVEGADEVLRRLGMSLRYDGWAVETVASRDESIERITEHEPDVVIVGDDPERNAMELLTRIRSTGSRVPILFLADGEEPRDRLMGLTTGGDDVLVKPFSLEDLLARMRALVRRSRTLRGEQPDPRIVLGDLTLDEDLYEVDRAGEPIDLTTTEFELLRFLMRNPKRVFSKAQLLDHVWKYDYDGGIAVVELYISYLRKKLDDGRSPMLRTVRSAGYMLKAAD